MYDLIVVGGGASGLTAAICAMRRNKKVLVLEKEDKVGKKILVTGNGKCNLSNEDMSAEKYNTNFVKRIIKNDVKSFIRSLGIATKDIETRIYPYSESALSVVNKLRENIPSDAIITGCEVKEIFEDGTNFSVCGYKTRAVALCTGSNATKGTASYGLLSKFGHTVGVLSPSIVPLRTDTAYIKGLTNLRAKAIVTLKGNGAEYQERGEILFKDNGISGIAAMMLSTYCARKGGDYTLFVDFAPDFSEKEVKEFLEKYKLDGMLQKAIAQSVEKQARDYGLPLYVAVKNFAVKNVRLGDVKNAQVICGGLSVEQFDEKLESKLKRGLFAGGEVLDVDGECGGYNLHFAFASGMTIGDNV